YRAAYPFDRPGVCQLAGELNRQLNRAIMNNVRTAMESLMNAHSLVGELTLLRRNLLVCGLYRQTRAHQFDSHDRPHELQGPFELHETRHFSGHDPAVI